MHFLPSTRFDELISLTRSPPLPTATEKLVRCRSHFYQLFLLSVEGSRPWSLAWMASQFPLTDSRPVRLRTPRVPSPLHTDVVVRCPH